MTQGPARSRLAVLASGGGSNLQAILDHLDRRGPARGADVVLVAGTRADAGAFARARARGIPTALLRAGDRPGDALGDLLQSHAVDLVALAGYLRLIDTDVVETYRDRILNVHPALLPAFGGQGMYGERIHAAVLAAGARVTGVTVHVIDEVYDRGRILAQWPVPVLPGDNVATLARRVLHVEHLLYPRVIDAVAAGRAVDLRLPPDPAFAASSETELERFLDAAL